MYNLLLHMILVLYWLLIQTYTSVASTNTHNTAYSSVINRMLIIPNIEKCLKGELYISYILLFVYYYQFLIKIKF
jgi:hypothetical protein